MVLMWSLFFTNFLILWSWFSETLTFFGYSFSVTVSKSNIYKILLDMQHVMLHILVENTLWIAQKWSLVLTSWRFTSTGPYFFESVLPGPYKGGPYKMIMRVVWSHPLKECVESLSIIFSLSVISHIFCCWPTARQI